MIKKAAEVKSARKNKLDETTGSWKGPNGEDLGKEGKSTRCKVGEVEFFSYDSMDEAIAQLSAPTCLKLVNAQVETNAKNEARAAAVGTPSEKGLRDAAFLQLTSTPDGLQKLAACAGDQTKLNALVEETISEIKKASGIAEDNGEE
jgi:hypothetical protein